MAGSKDDVQRKGNGEQMKWKGRKPRCVQELPGTVRQEEGQRGIWEPDHERP